MLDKLKILLENPFFKTLADFIKMFKSTKSFYSVFYFLTAFTIQQAIVWKYGTALSAWFNSKGNEWYWQLGAFLAEHGSIELVGLGIVLLLLLAFVEVNKDNKAFDSNQGNTLNIDGNNSGIAVTGNQNIIKQIIETVIIHNHKSDLKTPLLILAFTALLHALPSIKTSDLATQQIQTYQVEINNLKKNRLVASSLNEKIQIDKEIKGLEEKIIEIEQYKSLLPTLTLKLAKEAENIHKYQGIDAALLYLQGNKAQTQQRELDRRMKEFAQKFKLEAKLLIMQHRYDEAATAYKNMIRYDRSYGSLYEYAHFLHQQNAFQETIVIYNEILRLDGLLPQNKAMTLHKLATIYYSHDNLTKALETYQKALKIRKTLYDKVLYADTLNNIALIYEKQKNYPKAKYYYHEALVLESSLAKNKPTFTVAKTRNNLGRLYKIQEKYEEALKNYNDALAIANTLKENNATNCDYQNLLANTHNNLGNLYRAQIKYNDANQSFDKALSIYTTLANSNPSRYMQELAMTLHNYGEFHLDINQTIKAYELIKSANASYQTLANHNPQSYNFELANSYLSLAYYHKQKNEIELAQKSYQEALVIYKKLLQSNPNLYELDYAKIVVRGAYQYQIITDELKVAKAILSKAKYKNDMTQKLLKFIEAISK
ncbi:MAG: tetratricopeptide repeat protein [Campylobacterales bacterium]|nr:tetratricopeptide repeat protein [Campylobacterales bacterium]